jgi:hypothetical protein
VEVVVELVEGDVAVDVPVGRPGCKALDEHPGEHRAPAPVTVSSSNEYCSASEAVSTTLPVAANRSEVCTAVSALATTPRLNAPL